MTRSRSFISAAALVLALVVLIAAPAVGSAEGLEAEGGATWRLEQPSPPAPPAGVEGAALPVGLGKIGDIEFWGPNRGLLITAGNPPTIPAGIWTYDGVAWRELATVCGATDGRIAWAAADDFWTVSDGRPGQAGAEGILPPLADNTLCHFKGGKVEASYASLAFQASSYQAMHAAGCLGEKDCWFAGDPLPEQLNPGTFQLHWNGNSVAAEAYPEEAHAAMDMRSSQGRLYESVRLSSRDRGATPEPPALRLINPEGVAPQFEGIRELPLYGPSGGLEEFPTALDFLHLSSDERSLWGAAGPQATPEHSAPGQVTVVREVEGGWSQLIGPQSQPSGAARFPEDVVNSIAAEPATNQAWMALEGRSEAAQQSPTAGAQLTQISGTGESSAVQSLPSAGEAAAGFGPKGAAAKLVCPAAHDCWMATTQGWLYHLASEGERQLAKNEDPAFSSLITFRPADEGVPKVVPDAPPPDDSGLLGEASSSLSSLLATVQPPPEAGVKVALLSKLHVRLVHRTTLELSFHLAVKARVRLVAKRRKSVVASTPTRVLAAGDRKLSLRLDPRRWPTKLDLQSHALAPLPTTSLQGAGNTTVGTGFVELPRTPGLSGFGPLG